MTAVFSSFHKRWIVACGPFVIGSGECKESAEFAAKKYLDRHGYPRD